MRSNKWVWFVALALVGGAGCDDSGDGDTDGGSNGMNGGSSSGGSSGDGGGTSGGQSCEQMVEPSSTAMSDETGTVYGTVTLDADTEVPAGRAAQGDLYIAAVEVFSASCPDPENPADPPVGQTLIRCVDLEAGAEVEYEVHGIPPGMEVTVVPFLDVDENVDPNDPAAAGPSACDVAGLGEAATVDEAGGRVEVDLSLGTSGEFIAMLCQYPACEPE